MPQVLNVKKNIHYITFYITFCSSFRTFLPLVATAAADRNDPNKDKYLCLMANIAHPALSRASRCKGLAYINRKRPCIVAASGQELLSKRNKFAIF